MTMNRTTANGPLSLWERVRVRAGGGGIRDWGLGIGGARKAAGWALQCPVKAKGGKAEGGRRRAEAALHSSLSPLLSPLPTADCRLPTDRPPSPPAPLPKGEGRRSRRRASVLLVILVCFVVASAMFLMLARQALAERRAAEVQLWAAQARWIAEAAVERAAARLGGDAKYAGETWKIPAAEIGGKEAALARIHVEPVAGRPDRRLLRIEADYPDDPVHRARSTKQITIDLKRTTAHQSAKKP